MSVDSPDDRPSNDTTNITFYIEINVKNEVVPVPVGESHGAGSSAGSAGCS